MKFLLDTNILIYFLNQKDKKAEAYIDNGQSLISVLTRIEVLYGTAEEEKSSILELLSRLYAVPIKDGIADLTAKLMIHVPRLRKKYPDALIAATCLYYDYELVTANVKDFNNIPGLTVVGFERP